MVCPPRFWDDSVCILFVLGTWSQINVCVSGRAKTERSTCHHSEKQRFFTGGPCSNPSTNVCLFSEHFWVLAAHRDLQTRTPCSAEAHGLAETKTCKTTTTATWFSLFGGECAECCRETWGCIQPDRKSGRKLRIRCVWTVPDEPGNEKHSDRIRA